MAISATFTGDFSGFYDAVQKADAQLKSFGDGASRVGTQLNRMVDNFSGRKLIQDATLMVKAIEEVGGVTKLTGNELATASEKAKQAADKMRALGMDVPKGLQDVANAGQKSALSFDTLAKSALGLAAAWISVQAVMAALSKGWEIFVGFMEDSITAASDAEASQSRLIAAMRAQDTAMPSVIALYDEYAAALQTTTTYEDDAAQAAMALLVQVGDIMPRDMEKALQATADLAAGLGIDLNQAAMMVAKAATGQSTALNKLGVDTKDVSGKTKDFDGILTAIADKFGGQAAAAANTYAGRIQQLKNAWDDVQESVGRAITTNATVLDAINLITGAIRDETGELTTNQAVMNFISDAIILTVQAFALLADALALMTGLFTNGFRAVELYTKGLGFFVLVAVKATEAMAAIGHVGAKAALPGLLSVQSGLKGVQDTMRTTIDRTAGFASGAHALAGKARELAAQLETTRGRTVDVTRAQAEVPGVMDRSTTAVTDQSDELKKLATAQEKYADSLRDIVDNLSGGNAIDKGHLWLQVLKDTIPIAQMTRDRQDEVNKVMGDAIAVYTALGETAPQAMIDLWVATQKPIPVINDLAFAIKDLARTAPNAQLFATQTISALGAIMPVMKGLKIEPGMFDGFGKGVAGAISGSMLRAIEGGGNVFKAVGTSVGNYMLDPQQSGLGKAITTQAAKLPGMIGGAIGAALPVIGSMLGPAIDLVAKGFQKLFGPSERAKIDQNLRGPFIAAAGGIDALNLAAQQAGITLDRFMNASKVKEYDAAVLELQKTLQFQQDAMALAIETAQRYGFTLEELGPALARQELDKQAQQLFKDWEVLNAAGIDTVAITSKMAEGVNKYVNQAIKMGAEVPEAMRPMLETMAKNGQLLDANGNKIETLENSGISFTMSMSKGFQTLIDSVSKLTEAIARGLGLAVDNTSNKLKNMPHQVPVKVVYDDPGFKNKHTVKVTYSGGGEATEGYQHGTDGFRNFGKGTLVMLHGWEAVVPRSETSSTPGGALPPLLAGGVGAAAGGEVIQITINAQGAFFDTPGSLQQLANKVEAALSARHGLTHKRRAA